MVDANEVCLDNIGRDFAILCKRAKVEPYGSPLHTLRKSCIDDWARVYPPKTVQTFAGHSQIITTLRHYTNYTNVSDDDYKKGAAQSVFASGSDANPDANTALGGWIHKVEIDKLSTTKHLHP